MVVRTTTETAAEVDLEIAGADLVTAEASLVIAVAGLEIKALRVMIAASRNQDLEDVVTANREVGPEIK